MTKEIHCVCRNTKFDNRIKSFSASACLCDLKNKKLKRKKVLKISISSGKIKF